MSLESINAQMYEVAATEPLHDIKGHNANLLEYTLPLLFGNMKMECEKIIATVLGKDTKRCCDYRKALLLILHAMQKNEVDDDLVELFSTAAEIQELLYAKEIKQNDTYYDFTMLPSGMQCYVTKYFQKTQTPITGST